MEDDGGNIFECLNDESSYNESYGRAKTVKLQAKCLL